MSIVDVHVGRIEFGSCSGMIYSYEPIETEDVTVNSHAGQIRAVTFIRIQMPAGFELEDVQNANACGDAGPSKMVLDPIETAKGNGGRVYVSAARLVERMRSGIGDFIQVD